MLIVFTKLFCSSIRRAVCPENCRVQERSETAPCCDGNCGWIRSRSLIFRLSRTDTSVKLQYLAGNDKSTIGAQDHEKVHSR